MLACCCSVAVVENVYEELDTGAEFFFNESTQMLYVWPNASEPDGVNTSTAAGEAPPPELHDLVVPVLQQLIATTGTQASPVKDLTIEGPPPYLTHSPCVSQWVGWGLICSQALDLDIVPESQ